jgi:hypothetical protein
MVVGAVGVVVLLLFVGLAFGGVSTFGQVGQALGRDSTAAQSGLLKREQFNRTIKTSYSILGGGQNQDTAHYVEFTTTDATRKLIVNMSWTQTQGGASDLQLIVEKRTGDTWNRLGSVEGRTPQGTELNGDNLASTQIRLRVFAAGNQVVLSQDFSLIVSQWTA